MQTMHHKRVRFHPTAKSHDNLKLRSEFVHTLTTRYFGGKTRLIDQTFANMAHAYTPIATFSLPWLSSHFRKDLESDPVQADAKVLAQQYRHNMRFVSALTCAAHMRVVESVLQCLPVALPSATASERDVLLGKVLRDLERLYVLLFATVLEECGGAMPAIAPALQPFVTAFGLPDDWKSHLQECEHDSCSESSEDDTDDTSERESDDDFARAFSYALRHISADDSNDSIEMSVLNTATTKADTSFVETCDVDTTLFNSISPISASVTNENNVSTDCKTNASSASSTTIATSCDSSTTTAVTSESITSRTRPGLRSILKTKTSAVHETSVFSTARFEDEHEDEIEMLSSQEMLAEQKRQDRLQPKLPSCAVLPRGGGSMQKLDRTHLYWLAQLVGLVRFTIILTRTL